MDLLRRKCLGKGWHGSSLVVGGLWDERRVRRVGRARSMRKGKTSGGMRGCFIAIMGAPFLRRNSTPRSERGNLKEVVGGVRCLPSLLHRSLCSAVVCLVAFVRPVPRLTPPPPHTQTPRAYSTAQETARASPFCIANIPPPPWAWSLLRSRYAYPAPAAWGINGTPAMRRKSKGPPPRTHPRD